MRKQMMQWDYIIQSLPNFFENREELIFAVTQGLPLGYTFDMSQNGYHVIFNHEGSIRDRHFNVLDDNTLKNNSSTIFSTLSHFVEDTYSHVKIVSECIDDMKISSLRVA